MIRTLVADALLTLCGWLDHLPEYSPEDRRWYRNGLGCRLGISGFACDLELRGER